jgi:hypothetical protein
MAHIDIERKRAGSWAWIAAILVFALVIIGIVVIMRAGEQRPPEPGPPGADVPVQPADPAVPPPDPPPR